MLALALIKNRLKIVLYIKMTISIVFDKLGYFAFDFANMLIKHLDDKETAYKMARLYLFWFLVSTIFH